jgi:transcriptional regulator with XRE-family HTH domain
MHCGKTLTLLRKFRNTTQQQLAKKLNVKQQYISQLEKQNHINGSILDKVLKGLNSNKTEWEQFRKLPPRKMMNDPFISRSL